MHITEVNIQNAMSTITCIFVLLFSLITTQTRVFLKGHQKQTPDPKNSSAHPVLKFLDPLLDVEWVRRGWGCGPNKFHIQR